MGKINVSDHQGKLTAIVKILTGIALALMLARMLVSTNFSQFGYQLEWFLDQEIDGADSPIWSPTGDQIAFECLFLRLGAPDRFSNWDACLHPHDICIIQSDGSGLKRFNLGNDYGYTPAWSPDGQFLAWYAEVERGRKGYLNIYDFEAEQLFEIPISDSIEFGAWIEWTADNQRVYSVLSGDAYDLLDESFVYMEKSPHHSYSIVIPSPSGSFLALVEYLDGEDYLLVWEEEQEIFRQFLPDEAGSILIGWNPVQAPQLLIEKYGSLCLLDIESSREVCILEGEYPGAGVISPDGKRFVFMDWQDEQWGLTVLTFDSGFGIDDVGYSRQFTPLGNLPASHRLSWSSDSDALVFGNESGIYIFDLDQSSKIIVLEVEHNTHN